MSATCSASWVLNSIANPATLRHVAGAAVTIGIVLQNLTSQQRVITLVSRLYDAETGVWIPGSLEEFKINDASSFLIAGYTQLTLNGSIIIPLTDVVFGVEVFDETDNARQLELRVVLTSASETSQMLTSILPMMILPILLGIITPLMKSTRE